LNRCSIIDSRRENNLQTICDALSSIDKAARLNLLKDIFSSQAFNGSQLAGAILDNSNRLNQIVDGFTAQEKVTVIEYAHSGHKLHSFFPSTPYPPKEQQRLLHQTEIIVEAAAELFQNRPARNIPIQKKEWRNDGSTLHLKFITKALRQAFVTQNADFYNALSHCGVSNNQVGHKFSHGYSIDLTLPADPAIRETIRSGLDQTLTPAPPAHIQAHSSIPPLRSGGNSFSDSVRPAAAPTAPIHVR